MPDGALEAVTAGERAEPPQAASKTTTRTSTRQSSSLLKRRSRIDVPNERHMSCRLAVLRSPS